MTVTEGDGGLLDSTQATFVFGGFGFSSTQEFVAGNFNPVTDQFTDLVAVANFGTVAPSVLLSNGPARSFSAGPAVPFSPSQNGFFEVAVGDIDDDGDDDIIILDTGADQITVLTNIDGQGNFAVRGTIAAGIGVNDIQLADVDGVNGLDIVVSNNFTDSIQVYRNLGGGGFSGSPVVSAGLVNAVDFKLVDVNGDLAPDLVALDGASGNSVLTVMLNRGDGSGRFDPFRLIGVGVFVQDLELADIDNDGDLDILAIDSGTANDPIVLIENDINGPAQDFVLRASVVTNGTFSNTLAVGDLNGDGNVDIVTGDFVTNQEVRVLLGNGNFTFQAPQTFATAGNLDGDDLQIADFDGDSLLDIAVVDLSRSSGVVFYNAGVPDAVVTLTLSTPDLTNPVSVLVTLSDGLAVGGVDYDNTFIGTVVFAPGQTTAQISIPMLGDLLQEGDENFFVNLSNATNAVIGDAQGQVTITEDDLGAPGPTVEILDLTIATEGDAGTTTALVTVQLVGGPAATNINVDYSFQDQSARAGFDYVAAPGSVQIPAGATSVTFPVQIIGDLINETDETFLIDIAQSTPGEFGVISRSQATITIAANDSNIPILGGGLTFNGGAGQDILRVTSDAEVIELDATPGASQVRLGTVGASGARGSLNLVNLAGEVLFVTGGAGDNTIDLSLWTSNASGTIDGLGGTDTLVGPTATQITWNITGAAQGTVENFGYSNVENLQGTAGSNDRFVFGAGVTVAGSINGGLGGNDRINYSSFGAPVNVVLTGASGTGTETSSITNGFSGIEDFIGTGTGDSFTGRDVTSTWTIAAAGSTYFDGSAITFRDFASVNGGSGADNFSVLTDVTLDISTGAGTNSVTVTNDRTVTGNITGGANADTVTLNAGAEVAGNIATGDGNDRLVLSDGANVSGSFAAGAGNDTLSFAGYLTARDVAITAVNATDGFDGTEVSIAGGFTSVNGLTGSSTGSDALRGLVATAAVWTIDLNGTYNAGGQVMGISSFENLTGSSADDRFQFGSFGVGAVPQVTVNAGAGNDQLVANVNGSDFLVTAGNQGTVTIRNSAATPASAVATSEMTPWSVIRTATSSPSLLKTLELWPVKSLAVSSKSKISPADWLPTRLTSTLTSTAASLVWPGRTS